MTTQTTKKLLNKCRISTELKNQIMNILYTKHGSDVDEYMDASYDCIGLIYAGVEPTTLIEENIKTGWDSTSFDEVRLRQLEHDKYMENPFDVSANGVTKCKHCGSYKTISRLQQTRRADEQATNITICTKCNKQTIR